MNKYQLAAVKDSEGKFYSIQGNKMTGGPFDTIEELKAHQEELLNGKDDHDNMGFTDKEIKMAYGVLNDPRYKSGNMTGAVDTIEKIAKGLSQHPGVQKAIRATQEDIDPTTGKEQPKTVMGFNVRSKENKIKDKETQIALAKRNAPKSGLTTNDVSKLEKELANLKNEDITFEGDEFYENFGWVEDSLEEAEYQGRKVQLNKPMRGDVKKFKVYVKNPKGNVVKVNFGDPNMKIKAYDPDRRRSFRARHNCDNPGPKTKARYWSCRKW
jgi:hypothetical protein